MRAAVVAQLGELSKSEIRGSNPVISKSYTFVLLSTVHIEMTKTRTGQIKKYVATPIFSVDQWI